VGQRVHFDELGAVSASMGVHLHEGHARARARRLVAALTGDPRSQGGELPLERLYLADEAALGVTVLVEREEALPADQLLHALGLRAAVLDAQRVVLLHGVEEAIRLWVQAPGVEREHAERVTALARVFDEQHVLGAAEAHRHVRPELGERPLDDACGRRAREGDLELSEQLSGVSHDRTFFAMTMRWIWLVPS
jgi:hypothetical protein